MANMMQEALVVAAILSSVRMSWTVPITIQTGFVGSQMVGIIAFFKKSYPPAENILKTLYHSPKL